MLCRFGALHILVFSCHSSGMATPTPPSHAPTNSSTQTPVQFDVGDRVTLKGSSDGRQGIVWHVDPVDVLYFDGLSPPKSYNVNTSTLVLISKVRCLEGKSADSCKTCRFLTSGDNECVACYDDHYLDAVSKTCTASTTTPMTSQAKQFAVGDKIFSEGRQGTILHVDPVDVMWDDGVKSYDVDASTLMLIELSVGDKVAISGRRGTIVHVDPMDVLWDDGSKSYNVNARTLMLIKLKVGDKVVISGRRGTIVHVDPVDVIWDDGSKSYNVNTSTLMLIQKAQAKLFAVGDKVFSEGRQGTILHVDPVDVMWDDGVKSYNVNTSTLMLTPKSLRGR